MENELNELEKKKTFNEKSYINKLKYSLIICPYCNKNIPYITFLPSTNAITLQLRCICFKGTKHINLKNFLMSLSQNSLYSPKCCNDKTKNGVKYCVKCNTWYCDECIRTIHLKENYYEDHLLLKNEATLMCYKHHLHFSYYCQQCYLNLCCVCYYKDTTNHINHHIIPITKINPKRLTAFNEDTIGFVLKKSRKYIEAIVKQLHDQSESNNEKVINTLNNYLSINELLRVFLYYLSYTAFILKDFPCYQILHLYQTLKLNYLDIGENEKEEDNDIDSGFELALDQLLNKYIITQKNKYDCTCILSGHFEWISCMIQLNNGLIATNSYDKTIKFWDINSSKCIKTLYTSEIYLYELNNGFLATTMHFSITIYDTVTYQCISKIHTAKSLILCFLQIGNELFLGLRNNTIQVLNLKTFRTIKIIEAHNFEVVSLIRISPFKFASGSTDTTIKIWDCNNYEELASLEDHSKAIRCLTKVNENIIISSSDDETIREWDVNTYQCILIIKIEDIFVESIIVLPDKQLAFAQSNGVIKLIDAITFKRSTILLVPQESIKKLLLLHDGQIASVISDNTIRIWNI